MFYLLHFWWSTFTFNEISTTLSIQFWYKRNILDTCGRMIGSHFGIAFLLFFIKTENAVYTSCQNSALLFINGLTFDIMNTQNNKSLEFEWKPMLTPLRSVDDQRFSWLCSVFLKLFQDLLNSVQKCEGNFERDTGQKISVSRGEHMKDWK